jgi:hypothetical protein
MKTILRIVMILGVMSMAILCEKFCYRHPNKFEVSISSKDSFSLKDTIWVEGYVSSNVYDDCENDSVPYTTSMHNGFKVLRLTKDLVYRKYNSYLSIENFNFILRKGISFTNNKCAISIEADSNNIQKINSYKMGLIPKEKGDYFIHFYFTEQTINSNNSIHIFKNYELKGFSNELHYLDCNNQLIILNANSKNDIYFFRVE